MSHYSTVGKDWVVEQLDNACGPKVPKGSKISILKWPLTN